MNKTENNNSEIFVGKTLYVAVISRNSPPKIREVTVEKIGKKYFYLLEYGSRYPVNKSDLKYCNKEYTNGNFQLYRTEQEILDMWEKEKLIRILSDHFSYVGGDVRSNTVEQLRKVVEVLELRKI